MRARELERGNSCGQEKIVCVICFAALFWILAKTQPLSRGCIDLFPKKNYSITPSSRAWNWKLSGPRNDEKNKNYKQTDI